MTELLKGRSSKDGPYLYAMTNFLPLVFGINRFKMEMKMNGNAFSKAVPVAIEATTILFIKNVWKQAWARAKIQQKPSTWNAAKDKEHGICGRWGSKGTGGNQSGQDAGWTVEA